VPRQAPGPMDIGDNSQLATMSDSSGEANIATAQPGAYYFDIIVTEMYSKILLSHGSGGKLMHSLIEDVFLKKFHNEILDELNDSAVLQIPAEKQVCFTTDSYVVDPLFFPGGDIGKLAICGTVNDLSVTGAQPLYISCGLIVEEGLEIEILEKIAESMSLVSKEAGVKIVTGDLKVVEKNSVDKLFVNTSGIGIRDKKISYDRRKIKPGDKIIINGGIGEHGMAILCEREGFDFETRIASDCAPLSSLISRVLNASPRVKFMRDPTRGGVATTLNEIVSGMDYGIVLYEKNIPLKEEVQALCEILGFDPLYIANEGKVLLVCAGDGEDIIQSMRNHPLGKEAAVIGEVVEAPGGKVVMETESGGHRIIEMLSGEQLPRIC